MTLKEARAILDRWDKRQPGEHDLVLEADALLAKAWRKKYPQGRHPTENQLPSDKAA